MEKDKEGRKALPTYQTMEEFVRCQEERAQSAYHLHQTAKSTPSVGCKIVILGLLFEFALLTFYFLLAV